jgi:hypothetical protein
VLHLDHQPEDPRRLPVHAKGGHRIAYPTELIAVRIEDTQPGQPGDEDSSCRAHIGSLDGVKGAGGAR